MDYFILQKHPIISISIGISIGVISIIYIFVLLLGKLVQIPVELASERDIVSQLQGMF